MERIMQQTYIDTNIQLNELIDLITDDTRDEEPILIQFLEVISVIETYEKMYFKIIDS